jgi:hypothetical protein
MACAEDPSAIPRDEGDEMLHRRNRMGETTAPIIPVITTNSEASSGEPFVAEAISIATGVVTDLGYRDRVINSLKEKRIEAACTLKKPMKKPLNTPDKMLTQFLYSSDLYV